MAMGYLRDADLERANEPGQDSVVAMADDDYAVGVLADGVSQSFFGHLAASCVTQVVLKYLWQQRRLAPSAMDLSAALDIARTDCRIKVLEHPLPQGLPNVLVEQLEEKRKIGSQACFSAFVYTKKGGSLDIYQVGDVPVIVDGEVCLAKDINGRWSDRVDVPLGLQHKRIETATSVVIASDGVVIEGRKGTEVVAELLKRDAFEEMAPVWARNDDVSFVALTMSRTNRGTTNTMAPCLAEGKPIPTGSRHCVFSGLPALAVAGACLFAVCTFFIIRGIRRTMSHEVT